MSLKVDKIIQDINSLTEEERKELFKRLPEDELKSFFFEFNPVWGKALRKIEKEAIKEDDEGKTVSLESV